MTEKPYNPLDKPNLADSIQRQILDSDCLPLGSLAPVAEFRGAGVYALYYIGDFDLYRPLSDRNSEEKFQMPIYVGKAIPPGGRIGGLGNEEIKHSALRNRLIRHARSISEVENLQIGDFYFRSLIVDDVWIPLGENMLIETFQPLWNTVVSGFGSNPTGGPRAGQASSRWDTLHPGRTGAGQSLGPEVRVVEELAQEYMKSHPLLDSA